MIISVAMFITFAVVIFRHLIYTYPYSKSTRKTVFLSLLHRAFLFGIAVYRYKAKKTLKITFQASALITYEKGSRCTTLGATLYHITTNYFSE